MSFAAVVQHELVLNFVSISQQILVLYSYAEKENSKLSIKPYQTREVLTHYWLT